MNNVFHDEDLLTSAENQDISDLIQGIQNIPTAKLDFRLSSSKVTQNAKDEIYNCTMPLVDIYAEICEITGSPLIPKFLKFRKEHCELPDSPNTNEGIWKTHALKKSQEIRKLGRLGYQLDKQNNIVVPDKENGNQSIEDFLESIGIVLIVLPKIKQFLGIQGFATCFLGSPAIVLVDQGDKDYRSMFYTVGHELFHLMYGEGEELGIKPFAGTLLISKEEYEAVFKDCGISVPLHSADKFYNELMPKLLYEFPFYSVACLANTAHNYGLISNDVRRRGQQAGPIPYQKMAESSGIIKPYKWFPTPMHQKIEELLQQGISQKLCDDYQAALKKIRDCEIG